jgi:acetyltransferase-like isoleucine patch superfamily enzyme
MLITKVFYKAIQYKNPATEGSFHWNDKNQNFNSYFKRSFILRYAKWKIQRSPFPWLIKPAFNFIGNCHFGKKTVIENSYLAKEFLHVGENSYIGKTLLANHLWDKNLTIKGIIIGDNVSISDNCCIAPGTEIEDDVSLLPLSVSSKCEKLTSNSAYFHSPIKTIPEEELIRIINYKLGDNRED